MFILIMVSHFFTNETVDFEKCISVVVIVNPSTTDLSYSHRLIAGRGVARPFSVGGGGGGVEANDYRQN